MADTNQVETKRARVRRLFIDPLSDWGFVKSPKVTRDHFEELMPKMTDQLTYLSDDSLAVLFDMIKTKGEGPNKRFWPSRATITGFAELIQPRPVEEIPALISWFKSIEGPRMRSAGAGTMVATYQFFRDRKVPPVKAAAIIKQNAADFDRQVELIEDRKRRHVATPTELEWLSWFRSVERKCLAVIGDEVPA